jgi:hypothetical protein
MGKGAMHPTASSPPILEPREFAGILEEEAGLVALANADPRAVVPSYTCGHSTISTAAPTVLGYLFPADEADLSASATEAKSSRLWAGINFPIDAEGATPAPGTPGAGQNVVRAVFDLMLPAQG